MSLSLRRATVEDIEGLIQLRLLFQQELGHIKSEEEFTSLRQHLRFYLQEKLPTGEFIAWVAAVEGQVVATSGLILFPKFPSIRNPSGLEAYIFNMYTVPQWRRKGIASMLLARLIACAQEAGAHKAWLYATTEGQPVYAKAGFVPKVRGTLEMEFVW